MASCSHGVDVTACVVDAQNEGFQCVDRDQPKGYFISFEQGVGLRCASPMDTEFFIKACQKHQILPITLCSYVNPRFTCVKTDGSHYQEIPIRLENYFCLNDQDRQRVIERCQD